MHEVSIAAEKLFTIFGFVTVTNTLLTAWVVMALIMIPVILMTRKLKTVPSGAQNFLEMCIDGLEKVMIGIVGDIKHAKEFFGVVATIFIFVLFSNWFGLLPGVGSILFDNHNYSQINHADQNSIVIDHGTVLSASNEESLISQSVDKHGLGEKHQLSSGESHYNEHHSVPLFRAASSDLSFTMAIALWAIIFVQYTGIKHLKLGYLSKFINFKNPILFFVGLLEMISEFGKIVSFSFRLFGNVFAGEVLLVVITFLVPYFVPVPFYGLEVFVGLVQAGVFAALTLVFLKGALAHH